MSGHLYYRILNYIRPLIGNVSQHEITIKNKDDIRVRYRCVVYRRFKIKELKRVKSPKEARAGFWLRDRDIPTQKEVKEVKEGAQKSKDGVRRFWKLKREGNLIRGIRERLVFEWYSDEVLVLMLT